MYYPKWLRSGFKTNIKRNITGNHENYKHTIKFPLTIIKRGTQAIPAYRSWLNDGMKLRMQSERRSRMMYVRRGGIGIRGYAAGKSVAFIDIYGITDPLLPRLPVTKENDYRIGHFFREMPKGYYLARSEGNMNDMHPELAKYYEKIRIITRDPLFSLKRLKTVLLFNLGFYDKHRIQYIKEMDIIRDKVDGYLQKVEANPRDANTFFQLGKAYYELGLYYRAIKKFKLSLEVQPQNHEIQQFLYKVNKIKNMRRNDRRI